MNKDQHRLEFWNSWASKAKESGENETYMLGIKDYKEAVDISKRDIDEIMDVLPDLTGMDVLELASGVGRFTPELAKRAKHVTSTDFMDYFVEENRHINGPTFHNVTFRTLDATKLDYPSNSFDFIFFTWLLAYLTDEEVKKLAVNALKILRPGGMLFFRETHFTCACTCDTTNNAGEYRSVKAFRDIFKPAIFSDKSGDEYRFEHLFSVNSQTYTKCRNLPTLISYLWKKSKVTKETDLQSKLDEKLYNEEYMMVYNKVIKNGFTTPGGLEAAKNWLSQLPVHLTPDTHVLDAGCGTGGVQCFLIEEFGAEVTSVDLSLLACEATLLELAKIQKRKGCVKIANLAKIAFPPNSFDIILARETIEYMDCIEDIFERFKQWLKPSGQIVIGGYFLGKVPLCSSTSELLQKDGMHLISEEHCIKVLEKVGFSEMTSRNCSEQYIDYIKKDLMKLEDQEGISTVVKGNFFTLWQGLAFGLQNQELAWNTVCAYKPV